MKQDLITAMRRERQALVAAVDGVDEVTLTTVPICGAWTARDVLAHVAAVDRATLDVLIQARKGEDLTWAWSGTEGDDWNTAEVALRQTKSVRQLLSELEQTHRDILAELDPWPAEGGPFGAGSWDPEKSPIGWLPGHDQEHLEYLRALRAR